MCSLHPPHTGAYDFSLHCAFFSDLHFAKASLLLKTCGLLQATAKAFLMSKEVHECVNTILVLQGSNNHGPDTKKSFFFFR